MKQQIIRKIIFVIFFAALIIAIGHFHWDSLTGDHDHCPLCQLLAAGFTTVGLVGLLPALTVIAALSPLNPVIPYCSPDRPSASRAPPNQPVPPLFS